MEFNYRFFGNSQVDNSVEQTQIQFEPDTLREPTYFVAELQQQLLFREAISALHDVVVSDLRVQPKDRQAYFEWLAEHETALLADFIKQGVEAEARIKELRAELNQIYGAKSKIMAPYYKAQQAYFNYLLHADYDAWIVLDPVITVHPDEVFFECFSKDESTYARLSCGFEVFKNIDTLACGTTNIDYSDDLYQEFQKIRSYKTTQFKIDPGGFDVQITNEDEFSEEKIDLPDSWLRGFLQVSSAMNMAMHSISLHPMDVHNICFILRRQKEQVGPRSIRFILKPGQPVQLLFEPWNRLLHCPRSIYYGEQEQEIRIWGRRRLLSLERLIPIANKFDVHLLGTGMPSFFVADLGVMSFTLGLSGWTANDWSRMGNFDLLAPRREADEVSKARVFNALKENWFETADSLSQRLSLERDVVLGSLAAYTQEGRVVYDLVKNVYRVRELSREPLPMSRLRFDNERESLAYNFVRANLVTLRDTLLEDDNWIIKGDVHDDARVYHPTIVIDDDQRLSDAVCDCYFYGHNKLFKGPCEHMLALRQHYHKAVQQDEKKTAGAD